jgi:beta-ketodecanoyl-[acyl-carrier-protein] synthase
LCSTVVSGSGVFTPLDSISNDELVATFNRYVAEYNREHVDAIASGETEPLEESDAKFIAKVSGIKNRHVMDKSGILDSAIMFPRIQEYSVDGRSVQSRMGEAAARAALGQASKNPAQVDIVIVCCTAVQRPYPSVAIEIQQALGTRGFAYDLQAACSSMTFAIQSATDAIINGRADTVLLISPEICSARVNYRDRETHFLFGDAASALVIERKAGCSSPYAFRILGTKMLTQYSETVRNDFGFLNQANPEGTATAHLFSQQGKKLFRDIVPLASEFIRDHLSETGIEISELKRLWLHQANLHINKSISKRVFGREAAEKEAPMILDEYANTSSAGSAIAFHKHSADLSAGDIGVLCAFGAGYSIGSVVLKKTGT